MSRLPRTIRCGSRRISINKPNWLTGLATIGVNDLGTTSGFTMDLTATKKVIKALQELARRQARIENARARRKAARA